jgi:sialate O-acetylesterase
MKKLLTAFAAVLIASGAFAELKVDPVFSSNMVLQQQKPITFFGTADKGASVKVEFNGKTVTAATDEKGSWKAEFPAMDAGKRNYTVKISDGKKTIELKDILIGEVWFCSGQSNMALQIGKKFNRGRNARNCEVEVANAKYPEIRYAFQSLVRSHQKERPASYSNAKGWVKCDPKVAHYFSAVAYFFGRKLHQDLNVPIGLINASWGGTKIEPWISLNGYKKFGPQSDLELYEKFDLDEDGIKAYEKKEDERFIREMTEWHPLFEKAGAEAKEKAQGWFATDFDDSQWEKGEVKTTRQYLARWYRGKFKLPANLKGKDLKLILRKVGEKADIYLNGKRLAGWEANASESDKKININLKADQLNQDGDNVLAIRGEYFHGHDSRNMMISILSWGAGSLSSGRTRFSLNRAKWKMHDEFACAKKATEGKAVPRAITIPYNSQQFQTNLYNGMVAAWTRLPVRGVIWYQGCSNAGQLHYYPLHKTLIADWRAKWNDPEMPFLIVQLAGYEPHRAKTWQTSDPTRPSIVAVTRDIQQQMLNIPNVGLACTIDIGEVDNIHPANKQDVGKRLALEAERIVYGKNIVSRGPLFESAKPEGDSIRVFFKYADKGLKTSDGKAPGAFAVAGKNRKFVWADAKIDGNTVVVSSPKVKEPKYVRYAYAGYRGDCNLQNAEGLPAYPFRSDAFDYSKIK